MLSVEHKKKISNSRKGQKNNEGRRWKVSEKARENIKNSINKGRFKKGHKINQGKLFTEERKLKIGLANKNKVRSEETREKYRKARIGIKLSEEHRKNISKAHKKRVLEGKNNFWKGGLTKKNVLIRGSSQYKLWRDAVFTRDNYTCIWCGSKGRVQADHIKPFAHFPEIRFAIDNGRTLCVECHKTTDTYRAGTRWFKYKL